MWFCEGYALAHAKERVLPDGAMQLVFNLCEDVTRVYDRPSSDECRNLRGFVVSGARSKCVVIDTAGQASVLGVHFKPGGAAPFLRLPVNELRNTHVSMDALWSTMSVDLRNRLLEAKTPEAKFCVLEKSLLAQARGSLQPHLAVDYALQEFQRSPGLRTIASVSDRIGLSKRRFIQVFDERVGLTPKLFCRVRRFQGALGHIARGGRIDWAGLAVDCGYYDQAHFIHDFSDFAGLSPSVYLNHKTEHLNHVRLTA